MDAHAQVRKTAITTRVLQLVHELCRAGIHSTKRDLFYTDVKLFQKQEEFEAGPCSLAPASSPESTRSMQCMYALPGQDARTPSCNPKYLPDSVPAKIGIQIEPRSDDILNDAACMVGCTRNSLNVVATMKGRRACGNETSPAPIDRE